MLRYTLYVFANLLRLPGRSPGASVPGRRRKPPCGRDDLLFPGRRLGAFDAAYFCVITLATIGYGDLAPVTQLGKLFTMLYIIAGLGVISAFIGAITRVSVERAQQRPRQHIFRHHGDPDSPHSPEPSPVSHT